MVSVWETDASVRSWSSSRVPITSTTGFQVNSPSLSDLWVFSGRFIRPNDKNWMKCVVSAISARWFDFKNPKVEVSCCCHVTIVSSPAYVLKPNTIMVGTRSLGRIRAGWSHEGEAVLIIVVSPEKKVIVLSLSPPSHKLLDHII